MDRQPNLAQDAQAPKSLRAPGLRAPGLRALALGNMNAFSRSLIESFDTLVQGVSKETAR